VLRRPPILVGVLLLALALVAGCSGGSSAPAGPTRVVSADNGEITVPVDPQRVVATGYAVPALIEADAPLVGISQWSRGEALMTPEDRATYDRLPRVAGNLAQETNYEAIAAAQPDLIVIGVPRPVLAEVDVARLESIAPVVAIGPSVPSAWRELSRRQADAAGSLEAFDASRAAYEQKAAGLAAKYRDVLAGRSFGHLGAYGQVAQGTFMREYADSWGTNIAQDVGVPYPGRPVNPGPGSAAVSETLSIEQLPASLGNVDSITYTVSPDGTPSEAVRYVLDNPLWQTLPAVQAGRVYPVRFTEAATYGSAMQTLDAIDEALAPMLGQAP
jgi:iron complex transport system substrate-binding protein